MRIPEKGEHGYTDAHKRAQLLKTFLFFLIPIEMCIRDSYETLMFALSYLLDRLKSEMDASEARF